MRSSQIIPADASGLRRALEVIASGGIIAFPTETLYGLGARYDDINALKRLLQLKKRAPDQTIPLIIGDTGSLALLTDSVPEQAMELINKFWPGPLTLILRAKRGLNGYITHNGTVAVRIPGDSFALRLAKAAGFPVTSTSANISGQPPARTAEMAAAYFGDGLDLIIDAGDSPEHEPSTIIDATQTELRLIREGRIKRAAIFPA